MININIINIYFFFNPLQKRGTQQEELKRHREQEIVLAKQAYDEKEQHNKVLIKNIIFI
jgi:hypothetical protein